MLDEQERYEERAAIREFCGGESRQDAEEAARIEVENWLKLKKSIDDDSNGKR